MTKKIKNRLLGVVFVGLGLVALGVFLDTYRSEQKSPQDFTNKDNQLINFDWRDE